VGEPFRGTQGIRGTVTVWNPRGDTRLSVYDGGDLTGRNVTLPPGTISGLAPADINYYTYAINSLFVTAGAGGNTFTVTNTAAVYTTTLFTGSGNDTVNVQGTTGPLQIRGGSGDATINVGSGGRVQSIQGPLTITGPAWFSAHLNVDDSGDPLNRNLNLTDRSLVGLGAAPINYDNVSSMVVSAGSCNNGYEVYSTVGPWATTLNTGSGVDHVRVSATSGPLNINSAGGGRSDLVILGNYNGNVQTIQGAVTVRNSASYTLLVVLDTFDIGSRIVEMGVSGSLGTIAGLAPAPIYCGINELNDLEVYGPFSDGNTFSITDTGARFPMRLNLAGNSLVNVRGTSGSLTVNCSGGLNTINVGSSGSVQGILGALNIITNGIYGSANLNVDDSADTTCRTVTLSDSGVNGLGPAAINYQLDQLRSLRVSGGSGGNLFTVQTSAGPSPLTLNPGSGTNGSLTKNGTGVLTLVGANNYTGPTVVNGGALRLGADNAVPAASAVTVNAGATFDVGIFMDRIGSLAGAGNVTLDGILEVGGDSSSTTFSGVISDLDGLFRKYGPGTLTLTGNSPSMPPALVSGGTLQVNGDGSEEAFTRVENGGTLGGRGTVGPIPVRSGGTLAAGDSSPGILHSREVRFFQGSAFRARLNAATAGSGYDQLSARGAVYLGGNPTLSLSLGFASAPGDQFTIITSTGGIVGSFNGLRDGDTFNVDGALFQINYTSNRVVVTNRSVLWNNANGGNWATAGNWSSGRLPGPADDVVIRSLSAGATITYSSGSTAVHSLTVSSNNPVTLAVSGGSLELLSRSAFNNQTTLNFSGGDFKGAGDLIAGGVVNWTGGTFSGTGTLTIRVLQSAAGRGAHL
jgi:autotransporter-associated beta strand protein